MIFAQESMRVAVPPMSAYEHLVRSSEHARFRSGLLAVTHTDETAAHVTLDIGGRRVEIDAVLAGTEPGRFVRWDSDRLIESFWLEPLEDDATNVVAVVALDDRLVELLDGQPGATLHARLREDLKGFKRCCEEAD